MNKKPRLVALDLDGTLKPQNGPVSQRATSKIRKLKSRGILFVLATGRCTKEVDQLVETDLFDAIVAENGALMVVGRSKTILAPQHWLEKRKRLVKDTSGCEEVIVSMGIEKYREALRLAQALGGHVEKNRDRLMVLPPNTNKGSGLAAVLKTLRVDPASAACVGDGENDVSLFTLCGLRVALKNSVPQLKLMAHYVAQKEDGEGVAEALDHIFAEDL